MDGSRDNFDMLANRKSLPCQESNSDPSASRSGIPNLFHFGAHLIVDNFFTAHTHLLLVIKYKVMKKYIYYNTVM
jgi:hypothetical protein